jgi:hypothetical protein
MSLKWSESVIHPHQWHAHHWSASRCVGENLSIPTPVTFIPVPLVCKSLKWCEYHCFLPRGKARRVYHGMHCNRWHAPLTKWMYPHQLVDIMVCTMHSMRSMRGGFIFLDRRPFSQPCAWSNMPHCCKSQSREEVFPHLCLWSNMYQYHLQDSGQTRRVFHSAWPYTHVNSRPDTLYLLVIAFAFW